MNSLPIDVTKQHTMPLATAKEKTEQIAKNMKSKYGIDYVWNGDLINFCSTSGLASGVKGFLRVTATTIQVHIELTPYLRMIAGSAITSQVEQYLKDAGAR